MINLTDSISACTASGILAYAKQIYHQMSGGTGTNVEDLLNDHDAKIQSAIKLNEYNEVNITYPFYEEHEGSILCNLTKDDDKIIQDHSDWGSEFADYVRSSNLYIATNMGNTGIGILGDDFTGYDVGEEIGSVYDSSDKSTIVSCFQSASDYWIVETESELTGLTSSNNLYYSIGTYRKKSDKTPFRLDQDGSLYLLHVGGYDGDKNTANNSQSLQEVIGELEEQIASASTSGSNLSLDENSNLLVNEKYITVDGSDNFLKASDYISYNLSGSSSEYNLELYGGYMYRDFHYQFVKFLEDAEILNDSGQTVATITNATYESSTKNITITTDPDLGDLYNNNFYLRNQNIAVSSICLGGFLNKGDYSTLIGYDNYNTGSGNMTLGSGNANDGQGTVIVGNYNSIQNEHNGYPCYIFGEYNKANDDSMLCVLGSHNESTGDYLESFGLGGSIKFTRGINVGNDILRQVGIGVGLDISHNEFVIGQFNKDYDIADSSKKNFFTVGNGTEFTKSNSLEQKVNGDLYVLGIGGFDGTNSLSSSTKSLQEVISGISASTESKLSQTPNNSVEFGPTNFVNDTSNSFAGGVGVNILGDRAFGFGETYIAVYLTGNGQDDGDGGYPYSLMIGNATSYSMHNIVAQEFAKTHIGSLILDTTDNFRGYAKITAITYNGDNNPLTVTLDYSLGQKTNAVWTVQNISKSRTFSVGGFGNIGQYGVTVGNLAFNSGKDGIVLGSYNGNGGQSGLLLGGYNKNAQTGGILIGLQNANTGQYSNVIGLQNTNSGDYANVIGRNNNNKCASTSIIGIANEVKETTYPSAIIGYNNSGETQTQQFTLGYDNHGTRGQYAPNSGASCTWMVGHNLITSRGGIAMGRYNKDYDVQDTNKQNFFVIGQGDSSQRLNSVEVKANGDLYVVGVGGFNGVNSETATVKTLQAKITELENRIAQLEGLMGGGNS